MPKARILLSGKSNIHYYIDAVSAAGAEPVAVYLPEISTDYDGLILCGGHDIDPKYYHQPMNGSGELDAPRDEVEFALLKAFIAAGKPVFGICRGLQLMNIYFGGTLVQDIPEKLLHIKNGTQDNIHTVDALDGSLLCRLYGSSFSVNSAHHQAIDELGEGLIATARWNGTYIEAIEHRELPIFAVQWHPERMCVSKQRGDTVDGLKLFAHFLRICEH